MVGHPRILSDKLRGKQHGAQGIHAAFPFMHYTKAGIVVEKLLGNPDVDAGALGAADTQDSLVLLDPALNLLANSPRQVGGSKPHHYIYNNALRNMAHKNFSQTNVQGESIGVLAEGETKELAFELGVTLAKWNFKNMSVLVVVTAKDDNNRWEVVNSLCCPIDEFRTFEYLE